MQVVAFSSPRHPAWRWRIIDYAGSMVEESHEHFASIAAAVADGNRRLTALADEQRGSRPAGVSWRRDWR